MQCRNFTIQVIEFRASEVTIDRTNHTTDIHYGKHGWYFRTSSSSKWAKRSIHSIFHLFIQVSMWEKQFLPLKLNKQMENLICISFCSFGGTWGCEISGKFSILVSMEAKLIGICWHLQSLFLDTLRLLLKYE